MKSNHLIHEKSPYLLQHAYNPVEWYSWGEEAFKKARRENKPIFLSIGYSTCHWCHVMEKESFSNEDIAAILNKHFIAIKVDREERPAVDKIYMTAVQTMTGGGGWPLSVWLTTDLKPFFGGTYFPPEPRWGRPGFPQILERIAELWESDRDKLLGDAGRLAESLKSYAETEGQATDLNEQWFENAYEYFRDNFDSDRGGFRGAPKFPMPVNQNFLFRYYARTGNKKALEMLHFTLREMSKGGIYDQVGGGFHRYSTDADWFVPHFEKMLYDNAQLAVNYLEMYQISRDPEMARVARETLAYILRDMTDAQGGFYSAEDADSLPLELAQKGYSDEGHEHKSEGAFYLWEISEVDKVIGQDHARIISYLYGIEQNGNVQQDPQGEFREKNILFLKHSIQETSKKFGKSEEEIQKIVDDSKKKLLSVRAQRPRPGLDDKVLTSWNGLMISAFAKGYQVLGDPIYLQAAEKAAHFIRNHLYDRKEKNLYHRWRKGDRAIPGLADDYAFLIQGLLDLYESNFDVSWLEWSVELMNRQNDLFYDSKNGGFFMTSLKHDQNLLVRVLEDSDNVEPSASSVSALNLIRLTQYTDQKEFREKAMKTLKRFGGQMQEQPRSLPQMLVAMDFAMSKPKQIIIAGAPSDEGTQKMLEEVYSRYLPVKILMVLDGNGSKEKLVEFLPFLKGIVPIGGKTTAYLCIDYSCKLPTNDLKVFVNQLDGNDPYGG